MITSKEQMAAISRHRVMAIVEEFGSISADAFCAEMIRRGWAYPDLTPESIGLEPTDIVQRRRHS